MSIKSTIPSLRLPGLTGEPADLEASRINRFRVVPSITLQHPLAAVSRSVNDKPQTMSAAPATLLPNSVGQGKNLLACPATTANLLAPLALTPPPSTLSLASGPATSTPQLRRSISAPIKSRRVNLGPGCSMLDWIRLCKNTPDMAGNGGTPRPVTDQELAQHCTEDDAWTSYKGKVYNITAYFRFHPGGKEDLLKAAGKDCTILFDEAHKWVNIQSMLKKCYVGDLVGTPSTRRDSNSFRSRTNSRTCSDLLLNVAKPLIVVDGMNRHAVAKRESESSEDALVHTPQSPVNPPFHVTDETDSIAIIMVPPSPIRKNSDASRPTVPRWDWYQNNQNIMIHVFTHNKNLRDSDIVADVTGQSLEGEILMDNWIYQLKIGLLHPVTGLKVSIHTTKVEIRLTKEKPNLQWDSVGTMLPGNDQMVPCRDRIATYRQCVISSIETVTHDTKLFTLSVPPSSHIAVPIGHHVTLKVGKKGHEIERSYTPIQTFGLPSSSDSIQLMIKLYKDGAMSQHLANLQKGDTINTSNPEGVFDANRLNSVTESILIAAGSGFTPMVGILHQLLSYPVTSEERKHHLIFANKTEKDILWRKELDTLAKKNKSLTVTHILSAPDKSWNGHTGRVTQEFLRTHLPSPSPSSEKQLICVCGPQPFTTSITSALLEMEYPDSCVHVFD